MYRCIDKVTDNISQEVSSDDVAYDVHLAGDADVSGSRHITSDVNIGCGRKSR